MLPGFSYKGPDTPLPVPPVIPVTGANNGTSLSGTNVVLGSDPADPAGSLLSDREIARNGFRLLFPDATFGNSIFQMFGNSIDGSSDSGALMTVNNNITGNVAGLFSDSLNNASGVAFNSSSINAFSSGGTKIQSGSLTPFVDPGVGVLEIDFTDVLLTGRIRSDFFVSPQNASPVAVSATADKDKVFTNQGAGALVTFNLPPAVAGLRFTFYNQNANNISVDAAAGDTIRIAALVTAAGGAVTSTAIGDSVTLQAINTTEWVAISSLGVFV